MRIVLSNDDGILAPGLAALRSAVGDMGDVLVFAPESPQSAAGHGITIKQPLRVRNVQLSEGAFEGLSIAGRPADCVRLAVRHLLAEPPDLVLSGINAGANVGVNVFYSGTVAAAAEAAMCGIPAVAFSADVSGDDVDFAACARYCRWVLDLLRARGLGVGDLISVNVPAAGTEPRGLRVVPQSTAEIEDVYHERCESDGQQAYQLGDEYRFAHQADSDVAALAEGYITITPLHVDMTNHDRIVSLARQEWPPLPGA